MAALSVTTILCNLATAEGTNKLTATTRAPVIFRCGDSTMSDKPLFPPHPERGWGQLLPMYFNPQVKIENLAVNGRS